ncbi:sulfotransferase domain-containing protein [Salsipaludibacter albus]|uniref:sulfotransferase domain-containing protein n=1 Tax=Salsipaludibacter albus TaxID=2849650 RepID=UPI001EE4B663|nr:sulfotransferase domain-containing protein [Salsipaludibacter albus]MBY5163596.1 sulfotransferase domain-containing protein [Salsipaludibacter albus]
MARLSYRLVARSPTLHRLGRRLLALASRWRTGRADCRVAIISIPKAGTHLLTSVLAGTGQVADAHVHLVPGDLADDRSGPDLSALDRALATLRPGQFMTLHHPWSPRLRDTFATHDVHTLFIHRDPRAVAVSHAHYVRRLPRHRLHRRWQAMSLPDAILASMTGVAARDGDRGLEPLADRYDHHEGWLSGADLTLRFEDLVASAERADEALARVATLLGLTPPDDEVFVAEAGTWIGWTGSPTMRRGSAVGWRAEVDDDLARHLAEVFGADRLHRWVGESA